MNFRIYIHNTAENQFYSLHFDILNWRIEESAQLRDFEIRVFDHFGRFLFQEQRANGQLDISRLTSGQYILQIKTADAIRVARFVKQ